MNTPARKAYMEPNAQRRATASKPFNAESLLDAAMDASFVLRPNTNVAWRFLDEEKNTPTDLKDAIAATGRLSRYAELAAFGHWLLLDGHPGIRKTLMTDTGQRDAELPHDR